MSRPIRVLHTLSAIGAGGVEVRHTRIAISLPRSRFEHRFIGTIGGTLTDALRSRGVPVALLGPVSSVLAPGRYRQGLRLVRSWRPDLVHGAVMEGSSLGVVLARRLGVPMILEETSDPADRRPMGHQLVRVMAHYADTCVAVSPAVGRYLTDELGVAPSKVRVVVNGVAKPATTTPSEQVELRHAHGIPTDAVVVGTVSRLFDDHKRVTDLIAAFSMLAQERTQIHLVIVGSGPDQPAMRAAATATGFGNRIHFVGKHVPADAYYSIMDVFAIASSREAFGLVAAEAMRASLPVVATAVGGLAEVVDDRVTGFLVPPLTPPALADGLRPLIDDADLRSSMGSAGAARADELYSLDRYLGDVEELYLELVGKGSQ